MLFLCEFFVDVHVSLKDLLKWAKHSLECVSFKTDNDQLLRLYRLVGGGILTVAIMLAALASLVRRALSPK
jgi:hypothetical protein